MKSFDSIGCFAWDWIFDLMCWALGFTRTRGVVIVVSCRSRLCVFASHLTSFEYLILPNSDTAAACLTMLLLCALRSFGQFACAILDHICFDCR